MNFPFCHACIMHRAIDIRIFEEISMNFEPWKSLRKNVILSNKLNDMMKSF